MAKLRPAHIDGHDRICCGKHTPEQCEDCPMKKWEEFTLAELEYRRVKAEAKTNKLLSPDAVQLAWERYTKAARELPGAKVSM